MTSTRREGLPVAREMEATLPAGEAFIEVLRVYGVEHVFSSPGSEWPPVWDALAKLRAQGVALPDYLNCRHEELAVAMASGYARASGRLPAVLLHTGVGTLHGAMALRVAYHEQVPMVVAAGESSAFGEDRERDPGAQWLRSLADLGGPARLVQPYVKWTATVNSLGSLPGMVEQACRVALAPPQGPAFLSIPMELLLDSVRGELLPKVAAPPRPTRPDPEMLDRVAQALVASRSPLIITEQAGRQADNVGRLVELAELLAIAVVESQSPAYVNFPRDHPLHLGFEARPLLKDADTVLLLGCRGPWHPPSEGPGRDATVILADEDPAKAHLPFWAYPIDLCLAGSLGWILEELLARVRSLKAQRGFSEGVVAERRARWKAEHDRQRQAWTQGARAAAEASPVDARWLCQVLGEVLPQDAVLLEETTTHRPFIQRLVPRTQPGSFFGRLTGGLGLGMCVALGVKLALPERLVVSLLGDGAFNYNPVLAGLGFIQEYGTPILMVVFDNQGYASMKSAHLKFYPEGWAAQTGIFYGAGITPVPDYSALAPIFGGYGEQVRAPDQVRPALERCLEAVRSGRFALLHALLDAGDPRQG